jgi:cob(I)alamin adenosyltransferase
MEKGSVVAYCGTGVGKTSAALGNGMKAAGEGKQVYVIQFMKGQLSNEFLDKLEPEIKIFRFEQSVGSFDEMTDREREEERKNYTNALNFAKKALATGECDLLILDEILGVIEEKIATEEEVLDVIRSKSMFTGIILTGINITPEIRDKCDTVYNISKEK